MGGRARTGDLGSGDGDATVVLIAFEAEGFKS